MNQPYHVSALEAATTSLAAALDLWETRDDSQPQPEVRRAASTAMDTIDIMMGRLYDMRSRLHTEIRAADDANAARVDAMLASRKAAAQITEETDG